MQKNRWVPTSKTNQRIFGGEHQKFTLSLPDHLLCFTASTVVVLKSIAQYQVVPGSCPELRADGEHSPKESCFWRVWRFIPLCVVLLPNQLCKSWMLDPQNMLANDSNDSKNLNVVASQEVSSFTYQDLNKFSIIYPEFSFQCSVVPKESSCATVDAQQCPSSSLRSRALRHGECVIFQTWNRTSHKIHTRNASKYIKYIIVFDTLCVTHRTICCNSTHFDSIVTYLFFLKTIKSKHDISLFLKF